MKKFGLALFALAMAFAVPHSAFASPVPVSGSIAVVGFGDTFNSNSISFSSWGLASGSGGTLSGVSGLAVLDGFSYSHSNNVELFDVLGTGVTFTIDGSVSETIVNGILNITGEGWLTEPGFTTTLFNFDLSSSSNGASDAFEITSAATPEPASLLLMGTGLMFLAFMIFRKSKSSSTSSMLIG